MNASLLSQYIQGTKMPSPQQINKIIDGIHLIGQELKEMQLEYFSTQNLANPKSYK
jgi:chaperone required for assembly of F1-ATPase